MDGGILVRIDSQPFRAAIGASIKLHMRTLVFHMGSRTRSLFDYLWPKQ